MTIRAFAITLLVVSWFVVPQTLILHDLWKYECKGLGGQPKGLQCIKKPAQSIAPAKALNIKWMT